MIFLIYYNIKYLNTLLYYFIMTLLLQKNKPLLIHGNPGSGKTHMALELTKDMIVTKIDSSMLKSIKDKDYILDIVKKRNVTLMFNEVIEKKCLFIDDIHIFQKYDRKFFNLIINFIKECKYYSTYIILICNNNFMKNKEIIKIKKYITYYEIKYNYSQYYKKCLEIAKLKNNINLNDLDKSIFFSNYNLNTFLSSISIEENINSRDNYDPIEKITINLTNSNYSLSELYRICEGDEIILAYNMLENISKIIKPDIKKYNKIYESVINSDIIEYKLLKTDKSCIKYLSILLIANINYHIDTTCKNIIMNRYISKCMVLTNILNINHLDFKIYLYDIFIQYKDEKYKEKLLKIDKKEYERIIKIYESFYLSI